MKIIKKDTLFIVTSGVYSNYEVVTLCKARQDIDMDSLRTEYLKMYPEEAKEYLFEEFKFTKWLLVDVNIAEELTYAELHLTDYSTVNEMDVFFKKKDDKEGEMR